MKRYSYFKLRDTMGETLEKIKKADLDAISDMHDTLDAFKGVYEVYKILDNHYFYGDGCGISGYEMEYDGKDENNALFLRFQTALDRARRKNKPEAYQLGILIAARHLYDVMRANTDKDILPDVNIDFRDDEVIPPMWPNFNPSAKAVFIIERNARQQAQAVNDSMIDHIEVYNYATVRDLYDYQNKIAKTKYDDIFKPVYAQLADMAAYAVTKPAEIMVLVSDVEALMTYIDDIRHHYNELEAKYQESCGMISQYEEENRILRKSRKKLMDARNKFAEDNNKLRRERDRHTDLLDKLRLALEEKGIYCEWSEAAIKWRLYGKNKLFDELREHYEEELRIREKEKDEKDKLIDELNSKNRSLQLRTNMMYACHRSTDNANRKMAKAVAEFDNKNKELNRKIEALEKENKELKDTLAKDMEFGKNVGKHIADSIREGCDKGVYELHPLTRIDIHVEETNSIPINMPFDRYAIPRVSVIFNNTQTEMERDTAEHECEELDRKFKELVKENEELRMTLAMFERDANMARELCHNIAFNAERARNKTP